MKKWILGLFISSVKLKYKAVKPLLKGKLTPWNVVEWNDFRNIFERKINHVN
jgi:hypothetical protein